MKKLGMLKYPSQKMEDTHPKSPGGSPQSLQM